MIAGEGQPQPSKGWFVLYVKTNTEIKTAEALTRAGFEIYCPTHTVIRQWSDRKKKLTQPLFRNYIFIKIEENNRSAVFDIEGVVRYLFWLGKPASVQENEILAIQEMLNEAGTGEVFLTPIGKGDQVTVKSGTFKDQEAVVEKVGRSRAKLILKALGVIINVRRSEIGA